MSDSVLNSASAMRISSKINELRQNRQSLDRHLNLSQERRELETAFTEFYARQGVQDVTQEMIQQAIESYKENRFTFPGWSGSSLGRMVAGSYIWFQPRTLPVVVFAAVLAAGSYGTFKTVDYTSQQMHQSALNTARTTVIGRVGDFKISMNKLETQINDNTAWIAKQQAGKGRSLSTVAVNGLIDDITRSNAELSQMRDDLSSWGKTNVEVPDAQLNEDPASVLSKFESTVYPHIETVGLRLKNLRDSITDKRARVERLTQIDTELQRKKTQLPTSYSTEVALKIVSVERLLAEGNDLEAKSALDELSKAVVRSAAVGVLTQSIQTLEARLASNFKDDEGRKRFADLVAQAKAQAARGDQAAYQATAQAIESMALYVSTSLHYQFVNRSGVQTGFARTNDSTGNKRWYLVVEAVDATGSPYKMDIYNSETRQTDKVTLWGQEVPKSVFDKVRDDKKSDGILDDADLGDKAAGNYTVDYRKSVLKTQVTRWSN